MSEVAKELGRDEEAFAVVLGIKRVKLVTLRKEGMEEGRDWCLWKGRITYTLEGERRMRGMVSLMVGLGGDEVEVDEELGREEPEEMEVLAVYPLNRRLVECGRENGERVRVNVGSNENFLKGMVLNARPPWGSGRLWVLVGRRPRRRGKW